MVIILLSLTSSSWADETCNSKLEFELSYDFQQPTAAQLEDYTQIGKPLYKYINNRLALWQGTPENLLKFMQRKINQVIEDTLAFANGLPEGAWRSFILQKMLQIHSEKQFAITEQELIKNQCNLPKFTNQSLKQQSSQLCLKALTRILSSIRGLWLEPISYSYFPNILGSDIKIRELISQETISRATAAGMSNYCLDKSLVCEVDHLLADDSWVEVKNYTQAFHFSSHTYVSVYKKAQALAQLAKIENEVSGKSIKVIFAFFEGGISDEARKEFEELGVIVQDHQK